MNNPQTNDVLTERVWQAALAGLLHDVGKVAQRAQSQPWFAPPDVPAEGQPIHAAWSVRFIARMPELYRAAALPGAYHHNPEKSPASDKHLSELIALADKLSAGERADLEQNTSKHPPQQLASIFDRLTLDPENKRRADNFLPLRALDLNWETRFSSDTPVGAYETLRQGLEDVAGENIADPQMYIENLLAGMQRTTWCVPSAYYHSVPDISLYDHARMTAALAVCLADWDATAVRALLGAVERDFRGNPQTGDDALLDQQVALLIGGDISGVQDFIYTLTSKGAAKTLRGRSFYLQLLGEALLRYVLSELGLPYTNVIYSGGGNFFLLAPISAQDRLQTIQQSTTRTLLRHHGTALYLALGKTSVPARGFKRGAFKDHWDAMHRTMGAAKQQRYSELGDELYDRVFEPSKHGGNQENTCAVCGDESENVSLLGEEEETGDKICPLCASFRELGGRLTTADFVALGFAAPQETEKHNSANALRAFGMQFEFAKSEKEPIAFHETVDRAVVWALDDATKIPTVTDVPTARMTRYTVNRIPQLSFDELQEKSEGINRLGVLRMDVDNLGELFIKGFGVGADNLATLSRIAALSFQLAFFFEGRVKKLCAEKSNLIYAVYAGGDDVFLIAPWNLVPELARKIVADLADYTRNPDVHLSAGMAFIHGKYPVYQAAEDAKDALDQAKGMPDRKKNAFSFLGQAWKWSEFESVNAKFVRVKKLVSDPMEEGLGAPQAILQSLRQFALDEADKAKRLNGRPVWGKWMWLGAYMLKRAAERAKQDDLKKELGDIGKELSANEYREIGQWGTAARWAQLWLREKQNRDS